MAAALVPLQNITLSSNQTSVTFGSIPTSGYRDLYLVINNTLVSSGTNGVMRVNGDTGGNYNRIQMVGTGSSTSSYSASGDDAIYSWELAGTGSRGVVTMNFMDYAATDKHKTILIRSNVPAYAVVASANRWASTSAITSILLTSGGSFAAGSTFALYGVVA